MKDINCPYCQEDLDIDHDDGKGYEEDKLHEQQCRACGKYFTYTTSISYYYEAQPADCLNGANHKLNPVIHYPRHYPDWVRCEDCDYENRGSFLFNIDEE